MKLKERFLISVLAFAVGILVLFAVVTHKVTSSFLQSHGQTLFRPDQQVPHGQIDGAAFKQRNLQKTPGSGSLQSNAQSEE